MACRRYEKEKSRTRRSHLVDVVASLLHAYGEFGIKSRNDERWRLARRKIRVFAPCLCCGAASVSPLLTAIVVEEEQFILCSFYLLPPRKGKEPERPCLFASFNFLLLFKFASAHQQQQSTSEREKNAKKTTKEFLTFNFNFLFWLLQTEYSSLYLQKSLFLDELPRSSCSFHCQVVYFILRCFFSVQVLK